MIRWEYRGSSLRYSKVLPESVLRAAVYAASGKKTVLYVKTVQKASSRSRQIRNLLDNSKVPYICGKNGKEFRFHTGGTLTLAVLEPELRGYDTKLVFID